RNLHSSTLYDAFDLPDQIGVTIAEGLKLVEQRFDPNGCDENEENNAGDGPQPEIEPPSSWTAAQRCIQPPAYKACDQEAEQQTLQPVPKPRPPKLHGESIVQADVMLIAVEWKLG